MQNKYKRSFRITSLSLLLPYFIFATFSVYCAYHHYTKSDDHYSAHHQENDDKHCPLSSVCNLVHNAGTSTTIPSLYILIVLFHVSLGLQFYREKSYFKILYKNLKSRSPPFSLPLKIFSYK